MLQIFPPIFLTFWLDHAILLFAGLVPRRILVWYTIDKYYPVEMTDNGILFVCISNLTLRLCNVTHHPLSESGGKDQSLFSDTIADVVKNMTVPVTILHITPMSAFRSDAHVGYWSDKPSLSDCSHWCLPGVPDVWNEIVLSYLFANFGDPFI